MKYTRYYDNLIWTNHAIERMKARGLSQEVASQAFYNPHHRKNGKTTGSYEYIKKTGNKVVTVIGKQNEKHEWFVISAWIDPPLQGSSDAKAQLYYQKYRSASLWGKLWLTILKQLGFFL